MPWAYTDSLRFIETAKVAACLQHPSFLPVYDLGILGGTTPFYTTPPVRGEPLGGFLRSFEGEVASIEKPFPLRSIVGAVRDACRAVEYAHGRGRLHPDSVLIDEDFRIVMQAHDWRASDVPDRDEAAPGFIASRPAFMSPEQLDEAGRGVGPATDVYGVGGILHVILFGTPSNHLPGRTRVVEVIRAIAERAFEHRRPGTLRPGIRSSEGRRKIDRLVDICLKALAYERERRNPTAAALGAALGEWLETDRSSW
jgi:serine/threonine-protein kinase